jgi:hypothetical protein
MTLQPNLFDGEGPFTPSLPGRGQVSPSSPAPGPWRTCPKCGATIVELTLTACPFCREEMER